jgi:hypothetical protein
MSCKCVKSFANVHVIRVTFCLVKYAVASEKKFRTRLVQPSQAYFHTLLKAFHEDHGTEFAIVFFAEIKFAMSNRKRDQRNLFSEVQRSFATPSLCVTWPIRSAIVRTSRATESVVGIVTWTFCMQCGGRCIIL